MIRQAHTFDAAAWYASWSDAGGIVAMIGDRLWNRPGTICQRRWMMPSAR